MLNLPKESVNKQNNIYWGVRDQIVTVVENGHGDQNPNPGSRLFTLHIALISWGKV